MICFCNRNHYQTDSYVIYIYTIYNICFEYYVYVYYFGDIVWIRSITNLNGGIEHLQKQVNIEIRWQDINEQQIYDCRIQTQVDYFFTLYEDGDRFGSIGDESTALNRSFFINMGLDPLMATNYHSQPVQELGDFRLVRVAENRPGFKELGIVTSNQGTGSAKKVNSSFLVFLLLSKPSSSTSHASTQSLQ